MTAAREFLRYAERIEARARSASPGHAAHLHDQARALRAAAARIAEREAMQSGGLRLVDQ